MLTPPPLPITNPLPSDLMVGEPVVFTLPGIPAPGDNNKRMAFVVRLYLIGTVAACDLFVFDTQPMNVANAVYDPIAQKPGTFERNAGYTDGSQLLTVNAMTTVQDPSAGGTL